MITCNAFFTFLIQESNEQVNTTVLHTVKYVFHNEWVAYISVFVSDKSYNHKSISNMFDYILKYVQYKYSIKLQNNAQQKPYFPGVSNTLQAFPDNSTSNAYMGNGMCIYIIRKSFTTSYIQYWTNALMLQTTDSIAATH